MDNLTKFVVEVYDSSTECIATEVSFEVSNLAEFAAELGLTNVEPHATYDLDDEDIKRINKSFGLNIDINTGPAKLRARPEIDDFPYRIHSNRELALMLDGKKPLAVFCGMYPPSPDIKEIPERLFDPHVALGRFVKRERVEFLNEKQPRRYVEFYTPYLERSGELTRTCSCKTPPGT